MNVTTSGTIAPANATARCGNAGRVARGLLTGKLVPVAVAANAACCGLCKQVDPNTPFIKPYLMVRPIFRAYVSS